MDKLSQRSQSRRFRGLWGKFPEYFISFLRAALYKWSYASVIEVKNLSVEMRMGPTTYGFYQISQKGRQPQLHRRVFVGNIEKREREGGGYAV